MHSSLAYQQTDFLWELDKSLNIDVNSSKWLIHANVDFGQVEISVNHRLIVDC